VRRSEPLPEHLDDAYLAELAAIAAPFGISRVGVAPASVLERARGELIRRRSAGLHDGMQFTYKNPERSTDPQAAVRNARAVLVGARSYLHGDATDGEESGIDADGGPVSARIARYAQADHYRPLREGLWAVAHRLRRDGWKAVAFADDNSMVDREIAYRAGLGWFGKNANLLLDGVGSWFVLGSVVTTAPLPVTDRTVADGCGSCRRCIDQCPTGAIVEPGVIDASRCLAWVLQKPGVIERRWRRAIGDRIYGCDDCQEACPPTVRLGGREPAPPVADGKVERTLDALEMLAIDDDAVLARWGRWYVTDRQPRWLRRNALVVVGNSERGADARVQHTLVRYLADDDPMLRAHAVWAARELGQHHLLPGTDDDPLVAAELNESC
jgi:epoxyqueuosine reductase